MISWFSRLIEFSAVLYFAVQHRKSHYGMPEKARNRWWPEAVSFTRIYLYLFWILCWYSCVLVWNLNIYCSRCLALDSSSVYTSVSLDIQNVIKCNPGLALGELTEWGRKDILIWYHKAFHYFFVNQKIYFPRIWCWKISACISFAIELLKFAWVYSWTSEVSKVSILLYLYLFEWQSSLK